MSSQPSGQLNKQTHFIMLGSLVGGMLIALFVWLNAQIWASNTSGSGLAWSLRGGLLSFFALVMVSWSALMGVAFAIRKIHRKSRSRKTRRALRDL